MRPVLVIGSSGYVGRHVMRALAARNVTAVGADLRVDGTTSHHRLDLAFPAESFAILAEVRPDVVIQMAYVLAAACVSDPQRAIATNIAGVNGLFEACIRLGVRRVVYGSSGSVYGDQSVYGDRDVTEEDPLPPARTLYQLHKQFNETMAEHYNAAGPRFVGLRISSPMGAGRPPGYRPYDDLVEAAVRGDRRVRLDVPRERPLVFNHVADVAAATVAVALAERTAHTIYNLGGETQTTAGLAAIAREVAGLEVTCSDAPVPATFLSRISSRRLVAEFGIRRRSAKEWFAADLAAGRASRAT